MFCGEGRGGKLFVGKLKLLFNELIFFLGFFSLLVLFDVWIWCNGEEVRDCESDEWWEEDDDGEGEKGSIKLDVLVLKLNDGLFV